MFDIVSKIKLDSARRLEDVVRASQQRTEEVQKTTADLEQAFENILRRIKEAYNE